MLIKTLIGWVNPPFENPLYRLKVRHNASFTTSRSLYQWTRETMLWTSGCLFAWMILQTLLLWNTQQLTLTTLTIDRLYSLLVPVTLNIFGLSLLLGLGLDLAMFAAGQQAKRDRQFKYEWDLVRVTPLPPQQILDAYITLTRLRSWSVLSVNATARLIVVGLILVLSLFASGRSPENQATLWSIALMSGFFVWELAWRHRAFSVLTLAFSFVPILNSAPLGLLAIIGGWIAQGMTLIYLWVFFWLISDTLATRYGFALPIALIFVLALYALIFFCAYYLLYRLGLAFVRKRLLTAESS
ncbi:MAG: hypothetical protein MUF87_03305 [Anaerolineae bacterium]|nr:hypothetical protein [Anaerolineae bacterium]